MFGLPVIDVIECLRDSPLFRENLEFHEKNLDLLENKLEKIIKQCSQMVNAGRIFNQEQDQLVHSMWELSSYFSLDTAVQGSLNCLLDALREAASYQKILIDQAARSIVKKFTEFSRHDIKNVRERRHWFEKASLEMDTVLHRSSSVNKLVESEELNKQLWATRQAFRHTSIDYIHILSLTQAKKRHEIVDAILSYSKSYSTFYHQGSELCDDMKESLEKISNEVNDMRKHELDLEKSMENRHFDISGKDLVDVNDKRDSIYPVTMQGYLFKRNNNAFKSWNRRYFVLNNNKLYYRKRCGDETTIMEEDLRLCSVKPAMDVERRFCFEITSNTKSHVLQGESEESCQEWIQCLMRGISSALQNNDICSIDDTNLTSTSLSPINSPSTYSPRTDNSAPSRNKLWINIMNLSGNNVCCDCGSSDPKWASINLGITLCIECSGIHRSLGVHYTKVRSLTLDNKWDLEVVKVMEELGNDVINEIYLFNYQREESDQPNTSCLLLIPATPDCSRQIRGNWIKTKYVERKFVPRLNDHNFFSKILRRHRNTLKECQHLKNLKRRSIKDSSLAESPCKQTLESPIGEEPLHIILQKLSLNDITEDNINDEHCLSIGSIDLTSLTLDDLLSSSSRISHLPLMSYSLALGADKNTLDRDSRTPLHHAVFSNCAIAVEFLLLNGAKVNAQDFVGKTAMHEAAARSNILQVYRLIKYRADYKIQDNYSKTAVDYAIDSNEPDLVTLLRVATLSEQLDKEDVDEEMTSIMQELYRKRSPLLVPPEEHVQSVE